MADVAISSFGNITPVGTDRILATDTDGNATSNVLVSALETYLGGTTQTIPGSKTFSSSTTISSGDLVLSNTGGIRFGTTATATASSSSSTSKTLDDYEEGTWTPNVVLGALTAGATASATYTKIGNKVHLRLSGYTIRTSNFLGNSIFSIDGFPLAASSASKVKFSLGNNGGNVMDSLSGTSGATLTNSVAITTETPLYIETTYTTTA